MHCNSYCLLIVTYLLSSRFNSNGQEAKIRELQFSHSSITLVKSMSITKKIDHLKLAEMYKFLMSVEIRNEIKTQYEIMTHSGIALLLYSILNQP